MGRTQICLLFRSHTHPGDMIPQNTARAVSREQWPPMRKKVGKYWDKIQYIWNVVADNVARIWNKLPPRCLPLCQSRSLILRLDVFRYRKSFGTKPGILMKYVCQIHAGTASQHYLCCSVRQVTSKANTQPSITTIQIQYRDRTRQTDSSFAQQAVSGIAHRTDDPLCRFFPLNARQNAPKLLSIETKKKRKKKTTLAHTTATHAHPCDR